MELNGKKIIFLGDSITEGYCATSLAENSYWGVLGKLSGAIVKAYGICGTRIAKQHNITDPSVDSQYFITRVENMDADADVVVVFGGTNDYGHGDAPLGKMSDRTDDTFYGALHNLFTALIERYSNSLIVIMTPTHRLNEERLFNDRGIRNVASLREYVEAERQVAEYYSLPILDLYSISGLNPVIPKIQQMYMPDGLHPNNAGHELIARRIIGFLKNF